MRRLVYFVLVLVVTAVLAPTIHAAPAATIYVSNTNDSGAGSLRGQIAAAAPGDTIQFDASLSGQTITLTSGEIIIDKNLTIDGSTLASPVTISGNNSSRIFYLSSSAVSMTSLRLINGNGAGSSACDGGAIYLSGSATLTVDRSEFDNNHASCNGGAIYLFVNSGLTLTNNTFTNNSSLYAGGAVRVANTPSVTVRGNTFVDNTSNEGGALWLSATTLVENNTFFNNNGRVTIYTYETLTLTNNTFVGNDGVTVRNSVAYLHMRNNIIGSCVVAGGTISTNINNWIVDGSCSPAYSGDPHLMALADNGGPTQTAALQPDSPAIDLGISAYCPATDQRGVARHDGDGNGVATCDLGAYETGTMQCSISQGNNYTFANQSNVSLYVNTSSDLGCLYVEELPVNHPNATGVTNGQHLQTGKYWRIEGFQSDGVTLANTFNVNLTLPYASADSTTRVCKWLEGSGAGYGWDCDDAGATHTTYSAAVSVTRSGLVSLSEWAVGQNVGPTAVSLQSLSTNSSTAVLPIILALILLAVGTGTVIVRRRS